MKATAHSQPRNLVRWSNGFESNMPDWTTTRHCALSSDMLQVLKEVRVVMFEAESGASDDERWDRCMARVYKTIDMADGLEKLAEVLHDSSIPYGNFPKPPGFK